MNTVKLIAGSAVILSLIATPVFATDSGTASAAVADMAGKASTMTEGSIKDLININSATPDMLASIPGIGPQISEGIAKYREAHGAFKQIADLVNVDGVDAALLEKIKPFLTI